MLKVSLIKKLQLIFLFLTAIAISFSSFHVAKAASLDRHIVINQIQTNGLASGTPLEEFIEIYNPTTENIDLSNWELRYVTSTGNLLTAKVFYKFTAGKILYPGGHVVLATEAYPSINANILRYSTSSFSGLSFDGATVDLIDSTGELVDRVGWGDKQTILCETSPAAAPPKASSITRKISDGLVIDTDNNFADFEVTTTPTLNTDNIAPESPPEDLTGEPANPPENVSPTNPDESNPIDIPLSDQSGQTNNQPTYVQPALLDIKINELMIDPASPLSDSYDEWVELYNPNEVEISLDNYRVEAGLTGSYKYTLKNIYIPASGYLVFNSKETPIYLSNSGGKVSLFSPSNSLIDEVSYEKAETGNSYARDQDNKWLWTTTPTMGSSNIISYPLVKPIALATKAASTKSSTKKATTATKKATAVKKAATTKAAKPKAKKTTVVSGTKDSGSKNLIAAPTPVPGPILAVLTGLAVLYCCYEYRYEIENKLYQLKLYRKNR
ncbi:lamin tail domain-containing protein [Candidatus Saccharibacteria bacterium]|nr:lamin tail domain-containing protein [Candidatus Saccharibacteria bacterium]